MKNMTHWEKDSPVEGVHTISQVTMHYKGCLHWRDSVSTYLHLTMLSITSSGTIGPSEPPELMPWAAHNKTCWKYLTWIKSWQNRGIQNGGRSAGQPTWIFISCDIKNRGRVWEERDVTAKSICETWLDAGSKKQLSRTIGEKIREIWVHTVC